MVVWRLSRSDLRGAGRTSGARARILSISSAGAVNLRAGIAPEALAPLEGLERDARQRLAEAQRRLGEVSARSDLSDSARMEMTATMESARDRAASDLQRAQESIKEMSPVWRDVLSARGRPATLAEIQRELLGKDELMLVYHAGSDGSFLFVIPSGSAPPTVAHQSALPARELRLPAGALTASGLELAMLGDPDRPAAGSAAPIAALLAMRGEEERTLASQRVAGQPGLLERRLAALSRVLMPTAAWTRVRQAKEVLVIPDGALHLLPFEALVFQPGTGRGDARFWLDDGPAVRYGSSATSLLSLARRPGPAEARRVKPEVLSVSNPDYATHLAAMDSTRARGAVGRGWAPLPGTARETEAIRRAFAPESVTVIAGAAATEARVRAALPGRRFVHFATHGFVTEEQSDVLAGLVLTTPDSTAVRSDDDGYLQLYEVYELHLDCDLAVLSACGTQRGRRVAGGERRLDRRPHGAFLHRARRPGPSWTRSRLPAAAARCEAKAARRASLGRSVLLGSVHALRPALAIAGLEVPPGFLGERHQVGTNDLDGQRNLVGHVDRTAVGDPPAGQHVGLTADQPVDSDAGPGAVGQRRCRRCLSQSQ
jgi:hypothetical protein